MTPKWLMPKAPALSGEARTVGEIDKKRRAAARKAKWLRGPKGRAWLARNRLRRNAYQLARYYANHEQRRAYLNSKQIEYRRIKTEVMTS